ncbi:hypothetical protein DV096_13625 [Bradymonadaceae bacterium TMQ3]|uniref:Acyloxyacyl hydrolase n=1 Tax=Lujinxingia sediminis TaxID=2480984 RepID=A0ABY0CTW8_9DELT|nr:hypothetical protein [Lujinxingia sediminis]RDV37542.1 hypothetical protein DV096_13625 [Bradymonadaceae bacterium TMQ3]RVU45769.1 hypothetical protein EA187_08375 [Lujinxingia sediminis]TXC75097.1 hypothetical protein FRC91_13515 [Bradymonadales bacterium TMQ1]
MASSSNVAVALVVMGSVIMTTTLASAQEQFLAPSALRETTVNTRVHVPGLRLEYGLNDRIGLGAGYMYACESRFPFARMNTMVRAGVGVDFTLVVPSNWERIEGGTLYGRGRLSGMGPFGGLTLELGLGVGVERRGVVPGATLGAYYAGEHFEIGYFYQAVLQHDRPAWMPAHHVGLRLHLPVEAK